MTSLLAVAIVSAAVLAGLSGYAIVQRNEAVTAERQAFSRELAANAALLQDEDPELRLRLSFEALRVAPTEQAQISVRKALIVYNDSHLRTVFEGHKGSVRWATFDPTGNYVATASEDGSAALWSREGGRPLRSFVSGANHNGHRILTAGEDRAVTIWDADTGQK
jgi:WD40 repeat protein